MGGRVRGGSGVRGEEFVCRLACCGVPKVQCLCPAGPEAAGRWGCKVPLHAPAPPPIRSTTRTQTAPHPHRSLSNTAHRICTFTCLMHRQVMSGRRPWVRADDGALLPNERFLNQGPDITRLSVELPEFQLLIQRSVIVMGRLLGRTAQEGGCLSWQ